MEKHDIENRQDVELLVRTFYGKVRDHEVLGPIFNEKINDWESHLIQLVDFWESMLLMVNKYQGNPMQAHIEVDAHFDHSIEQAHFGHWLELWLTTLHEHFDGIHAETAKERARNMSHMLFMRMFQSRPHK
ncbi:MAG: group III truncated hemoglobin [Cyclobacteriaceae bacterium]|nr:group III truncated hemoglobin [Cyclobacteriaceae bacterium]